MSPRVLIFVLVGFATPFRQAVAQESQKTVPVKLTDLRPPSAPAFALLGIEPQVVDRPKTPRALAVSVLTATNQLSAMPQNYALEVAPYWLATHPTLTFSDGRATLGSTFLQTLSLSVATAKDTIGTHLGLGIRALLAGGHPSRAGRLMLDSIRTLQDSALAAIVGVDIRDSAGIYRAVEPFAAGSRAIASRLSPELERAGFRAELAVGTLFLFPSATFDDGRSEKLAVWVNLAYQLERPRLDMAALVRLTSNSGSGTGTLVDIGGRMSFELAPLTVSAEFVGRSAIDAQVTQSGPGQVAAILNLRNSYRATGSIEIALGDGSALVLGLGRDFDQPGGTAGRLISLAALKLGLGAINSINVPIPHQ